MDMSEGLPFSELTQNYIILLEQISKELQCELLDYNISSKSVTNKIDSSEHKEKVNTENDKTASKILYLNTLSINDSHIDRLESIISDYELGLIRCLQDLNENTKLTEKSMNDQENNSALGNTPNETEQLLYISKEYTNICYEAVNQIQLVQSKKIQNSNAKNGHESQNNAEFVFLEKDNFQNNTNGVKVDDGSLEILHAGSSNKVNGRGKVKEYVEDEVIQKIALDYEAYNDIHTKNECQPEVTVNNNYQYFNFEEQKILNNTGSPINKMTGKLIMDEENITKGRVKKSSVRFKIGNKDKPMIQSEPKFDVPTRYEFLLKSNLELVYRKEKDNMRSNSLPKLKSVNHNSTFAYEIPASYCRRKSSLKPPKTCPKRSYSLSDLNTIANESLPIMFDVRFAYPEVKDVMDESNKIIQPKFFIESKYESSNELSFIESPKVNSTENRKIKKTKQQVFGKVIYRTFSWMDLRNKDDSSCLPNCFRRHKFRKKKNIQHLSVPQENFDLRRSSTSESFASIFLNDQDLDVKENINNSIESYISLSFPEQDKNDVLIINKADETADTVSISDHLKVRRCISSQQNNPLRKHLFRKLLPNESTSSLNPEALRKAQEMLNKSLAGVQRENISSSSNVIKIDSSFSSSKYSNDDSFSVSTSSNANTNDLGNFPNKILSKSSKFRRKNFDNIHKLSMKNLFSKKSYNVESNENSFSSDTLDDIYSSLPDIHELCFNENNGRESPDALNFPFDDVYNSVQKSLKEIQKFSLQAVRHDKIEESIKYIICEDYLKSIIACHDMDNAKMKFYLQQYLSNQNMNLKMIKKSLKFTYNKESKFLNTKSIKKPYLKKGRFLVTRRKTNIDLTPVLINMKSDSKTDSLDRENGDMLSESALQNVADKYVKSIRDYVQIMALNEYYEEQKQVMSNMESNLKDVLQNSYLALTTNEHGLISSFDNIIADNSKYSPKLENSNIIIAEQTSKSTDSRHHNSHLPSSYQDCFDSAHVGDSFSTPKFVYESSPDTLKKGKAFHFPLNFKETEVVTIGGTEDAIVRQRNFRPIRQDTIFHFPLDDSDDENCDNSMDINGKQNDSNDSSTPNSATASLSIDSSDGSNSKILGIQNEKQDDLNGICAANSATTSLSNDNSDDKNENLMDNNEKQNDSEDTSSTYNAKVSLSINESGDVNSANLRDTNEKADDINGISGTNFVTASLWIDDSDHKISENSTVNTDKQKDLNCINIANSATASLSIDDSYNETDENSTVINAKENNAKDNYKIYTTTTSLSIGDSGDANLKNIGESSKRQNDSNKFRSANSPSASLNEDSDDENSDASTVISVKQNSTNDMKITNSSNTSMSFEECEITQSYDLSITKYFNKSFICSSPSNETIDSDEDTNEENVNTRMHLEFTAQTQENSKESVVNEKIYSDTFSAVSEQRNSRNEIRDSPETENKEIERIQKDRCIEIYPETIRQRSKNMAAMPGKVDIKNWNNSSENEDQRVLPSVKQLRSQFENGRTTPTNSFKSASSSSSENSLISSSADNSQEFDSINSSRSVSSDISIVSKDCEELVEPIFINFPDENAPTNMKKIRCAQGWNPDLLLKHLYRVSDIQKTRRKVQFINIEGYLDKLPSGRKKSTFWNAWKRRYFVVKNGILYYYQSNQVEKPNMKLPLMGGKIEVMDPNTVAVDDKAENKRTGGLLGIDDGKGHYIVVRCSTMEETERWKKALETHIQDDYSSHYIQPSPRTSNPSLLKDVLVIDIGSSNVRAGVLSSQPSLPQLFFPSVVATNRETKSQIWGAEALSPNVRAKSSLSFPVRPTQKISKFSVDVNALSSLLQKSFHDLRIDPKDYNIQLSVPRVLNSTTQTELLKVLFDKFEVRSVNLTHQSILALYAYNSTSGVVVDVGERIDVIPITDGYIVDGGVSRVPYGGSRICDHIRQFLYQKNISLQSESDSYLLRTVLEDICYVARHYNTEKQRCTMDPEKFEKTTDLTPFLPDDPKFNVLREITMNYGRFQSTEGLFSPEAWGLDNPGIHKLVYRAIQECSMDIRKEMCRSIYLAGGVTQLPGMVDRLTVELDNLTPAALKPKVHASPYRYHAAFLGGCVLAGSPAFDQTKITRDDWMNLGPASLRKWSA